MGGGRVARHRLRRRRGGFVGHRSGSGDDSQGTPGDFPRRGADGPHPTPWRRKASHPAGSTRDPGRARSLGGSGVGPIPWTGQRLSGSDIAAELFLGVAACVMSLDPVSALCSCASTSRSWAERAATLQLHRCELLTCTRRLALALPERFRISPRGIWEVAPARRLPHQCGDAWSSGRTLRCLRNPFMLNGLEAWKTFPAPIPLTIRVWTRPHSAGLSEPVAVRLADRGTTTAGCRSERFGASANPPVRHVSALLVRVGFPSASFCCRPYALRACRARLLSATTH